jgi:hypothetical protein
MRIGVALSMTINVPFKRIVSADMKPLPGGCGDIALGIGGKDRFAYLALWPHARPWRLANPQPMMRAVPEADVVARTLAEAIASFQTVHGVATGAKPAALRPSAQGGMVAAE